MIKLLWQTIIVFVSIIVICLSANAGDNRQSLGIGFSATELSPNINLRYYVSQTFSLEARFGFENIDFEEKVATTRYTPGFGFFYHFAKDSDIRPLLGLNVSFDILSYANYHNSNVTGKYVDFNISPAFGMQYFFSKHFSVEGIYLLSITITDDGFSPSDLAAHATYVETTQKLSLFYYF